MGNKKIALIKVKEGTSVHKNAELHLHKGDFKYYDKGKSKNVDRCLILFCDSEKINRLFWCKCKQCCDEKGKYMECEVRFSSSSPVVITNTCESIFLDINKDFGESYIEIENSYRIFKQFEQIEQGRQEYKKTNRSYYSITSENNLHDLAQKNEYCKRQYDLKAPTADGRSEYQRDYDRIIYSKSFRRMVDKTQVFSATKGDHYRTRMTHTMIVCQIARSICNALQFNQALTESIAIAHDLGHTPFGHVGERTLNNILQRDFPAVGGFKHNYQGLRVVSKLEKDYYEIDGLDLSYQVMEGIFKHTKKKKGVEITEFINDDRLIEFLNLDYTHSVTIEGQIVAIADEIAQRSHDIDDAFSSNLLSIKEFLSYLKLRKFKELSDEIKAVESRKSECSNKMIADSNELFSFQISSAIVKYFIKDVINASRDNLKEYLENNKDDFFANHMVKEKLIVFSDKGELICNYLEKMLNNKVIGSNEVSISDRNSSIIIESLFNAYYHNPQLLHDGTKRKIIKDFINSSNKINNIIDLIEGSQNAVKQEIENIHNVDVASNDVLSNEYTIKQKILVRDICDYIAGMTDTYAHTQYEKICKILYR